MNLTPTVVDDLRKLCREYDAASDATTRAALGQKLDDAATQLSPAQVKQVVKILQR